jgi:hypothetical membrane protein
MTTKLALAGILAPIWFTALVVVQSFLQPDYSQVALPVSALAAWPLGRIQILNFIVFAALMLAFAIGLRRGVQSTRTAWIGFAFLVVSAVGLLGAGTFPWQRTGTGFVVPVGHRVAAAMSFMGAGIGLSVMSRAMAADPKWRRVAGYTLACGIAMVLMFVLMGPLAIRDNAPLHAYAGLLQRIVVLAWFSCTIVLSVRLLRLSRATTPRRSLP